MRGIGAITAVLLLAAFCISCRQPAEGGSSGNLGADQMHDIKAVAATVAIATVAPRSPRKVIIALPRSEPNAEAQSSQRKYGSILVAEFLLRKALVVTVPGQAFGIEGHLRLSYAGSVKDITEGIERIKWALDPESPNEIYIGDRKLVRDWL